MKTNEIKSERKQEKETTTEKEYSEFRPFPLYIILGCGLIIMFIGIYLTLTNNVASGVTIPGRFGEGGGQTRIISGPASILIGLCICIFPVYQLKKKKFPRKD